MVCCVHLHEFVAEEIPAEEITGFSASGIAGQLGTIRSVILPSNKRLLVIGARTHLYEGRGAQGFVRRVVHSVRTAAAAGAKTMVLTHGAGGIRPAWQPGTPVLRRASQRPYRDVRH